MSTIIRFVIWNPLIVILESWGCKKRQGAQFKSSFVTQEGGEVEDEDEAVSEDVFYLHIVRKATSKEGGGDDGDSKLQTTLNSVK